MSLDQSDDSEVFIDATEDSTAVNDTIEILEVEAIATAKMASKAKSATKSNAYFCSNRMKDVGDAVTEKLKHWNLLMPIGQITMISHKCFRRFQKLHYRKRMKWICMT